MTDAVRVAMIGVGAMTQRAHLPSLASFDDVEIAAMCDLDHDRLATVADRYEVERRYTDYRQMVDQVAPDAVWAVGQPHLMYDSWVWCLQHGLNLYIEKPLGLNLHQARMLTELAERSGVITQVGHQRRCAPLLVAMRERCLARGPITHAVCEFYKFDPRPFWSARDHMLDDGVHAIDTLRWICGGEIVAVDSHCKRIGTPDINWIFAALHFDNGSSGIMLTTWTSGRRIFRVQMHSQGLCVDADPEAEARLYEDNDPTGETYDSGAVAGSDEFFVCGGFQAKNREFVDSLRAGQELTSSPFRDGLKTMEIAEKVLAQALLRGD